MAATYQVPASASAIEFIEKKSRFLGFITPVDTEEDARAALDQIRKQHTTANHNVYAYRLRTQNITRYSDDGEPQGTAGLPVLHVLEKEDVTNVLCVVTRYFGGTLLGSGGLVRAYTNTAKQALDAAKISQVAPFARLSLTCAYAQYERLEKSATTFGAFVSDLTFGADVTFLLTIPIAQEQSLITHLTNASAGTATLQHLDIIERGQII